MIKYKIKYIEGDHPLAAVEFEDEKYKMLGEFMLAERSFRRDILGIVNEVDLGLSYKEYFSGNVYTLMVTPESCVLTNNLDDDAPSLKVDTPEFKKIFLDYMYALRELSVKDKMSRHGRTE